MGNSVTLSQLQGLARPAARIKVLPEDWRVTEELERSFADSGEHHYLYVRKRCLSTIPVASWLAKAFDVPAVDVGFAGMKDKHAVTEQWFSVRKPTNDEDLDVSELNQIKGDEEIRVLDSRRDTRKLRRGEHQANHFCVVLRGLGADLDLPQLQRRLEAGFPNYFGPQRFGRHNIADALYWLRHRRDRGRSRRVSQQQKGWHLSVLRSWIFNQLLAARVQDDTWQTCIDGDELALCQIRQASVPCGPLWGRGSNTLSGEALKRQQHDMKLVKTPDEEQTLAEVCAALEYAGVDRSLRSLVVTPWNIKVTHDPAEATLTLSFHLPVGAYATVLLGQWFDLQDCSLVSAA